MARRHCEATTFLHHRVVYRLSSRPFFAALGEPNNRNRREKQPATIKNKLMALDFVLANQGYRYLATERERLEYFAGTLKIPSERLPVRCYQ